MFKSLTSTSLILCTIACASSARAQAPTFFPPNNAQDISPDAVLRISFATPPTLGVGKIQIFDATTDALAEAIDVATPTNSQTIGGQQAVNYYPITISGNEVALHFKNHALDYGKSYYLTIDSGALKTDADAYPGLAAKDAWKFSTRAAPPKVGTTKLTVAADNTGDFCTLQAALDFLPDDNTAPTSIFIKKGTYTELIFLRNKHHITLIGEDRKESVIAYANNARANRRRSVMNVNGCNDFVMSNLTVHNTTPKLGGGNQAETIIYGGPLTSRAVLNKVDLKSFQDTLQINNQAYLSDCYIEGDIDFMWGSGPVFFENVTCKMLTSKDSYVETRNPVTNHGFVYYHCNFDAAPNLADNYIAQSVGVCEVVLIDCTLADSIRPIGWRVNPSRRGPASGAEGDKPAVRYMEYNSHKADGAPVDVSQRAPESRQLKQPDDASMIADYSNPTFVVGNNWVPMSPRATAVSIKSGAAVSFSATFGFSPDTTWQWQKNGVDLPGGTAAVYEIKEAVAADAGDYMLLIKSGPKPVATAVASIRIAD